VTTGSAARDRILLSFDGLELTADEAEALARRAVGVTLYRHLNVRSADQVRALTDTLQAATARLGLAPLVIAADHETGQLHALGDDATPFAGAMGLGATGDTGLAERVGRAIGTEMRAMGVNLAYAPVCDLATNPRNLVVGIRSFGDDPGAVGALAAATVRGLQSAGVGATLKHLPGHGDPSGDTHHRLPIIERSARELGDRELVPFRAAITAGARTVMAGHLAVPALTGRRDLAATLSRAIVHDLIRGELEFDGLTVSDALDMGALAQGPGQAADVVAALRAGTDLLVCGPDLAAQERVERALQDAFDHDLLDSAEARQSAARLDGFRTWSAGFDQPALDVVGRAEHGAIAAELATRSITLIRDESGLVPVALPAEARVLVIEPRPRDLTPADTTSLLPAGGLHAAIRERHPRAEGHIVDTEVTPDDIAALRDRASSADLVILGTVEALGQRSVDQVAEAIAATGSMVIDVALRGPWDAVAHPEIGTVLATYGIQPPSLAALVAGLWGDAPITGRLPVTLPSMRP
jgi:beta-N-acetylhexosaminidase